MHPASYGGVLFDPRFCLLSFGPGFSRPSGLRRALSGKCETLGTSVLIFRFSWLVPYKFYSKFGVPLNRGQRSLSFESFTLKKMECSKQASRSFEREFLCN